MRQLVSLGLAATRGNYRGLLKLFGMDEGDYKRFMNFLAAHECTVDYRPFRTPNPIVIRPVSVGLPFETPERPRVTRRSRES